MYETYRHIKEFCINFFLITNITDKDIEIVGPPDQIAEGYNFTGEKYCITLKPNEVYIVIDPCLAPVSERPLILMTKEMSIDGLWILPVSRVETKGESDHDRKFLKILDCFDPPKPEDKNLKRETKQVIIKTSRTLDRFFFGKGTRSEAEEYVLSKLRRLEEEELGPDLNCLFVLDISSPLGQRLTAFRCQSTQEIHDQIRLLERVGLKAKLLYLGADRQINRQIEELLKEKYTAQEIVEGLLKILGNKD